MATPNALGRQLDDLLDEARRTYREPKSLMDFDAMKNKAVAEMATLLMRKAAARFGMEDLVTYPVVAVTSCINAALQPNLAAASYDDATNIYGVNRTYILEEEQAPKLGPMMGEEAFHWLDAQAHALGGRRWERGGVSALARAERIGFAGRHLLWQIFREDPAFDSSRIFPAERPVYDADDREYIGSVIEEHDATPRAKANLRRIRRLRNIPLVGGLASAVIGRIARPWLDPGRPRRAHALAHHFGYIDGEQMTMKQMEVHLRDAMGGHDETPQPH